MAGLSQGLSPAADEPPAAGCATLAAEYNWSQSDLGSQDQWDPVVEAVVRTLLETTAPMAYCHGKGYAMVYNDRFAELLGARHPRSWGQRAAEVMPEIWAGPGFAEEIGDVFDGGPPFNDHGEMVDLTGREPNPDWAYLARSFSPVRDREGLVLGILLVVVEIAPVLVLVNGAESGDQGAARWRGAELWDETGARGPLIWSGFQAGARPPEPPVAEAEQRFVVDSGRQLILPINAPDIRGSLGYKGVPRHLPEAQMVTLAARDQNDTSGAAARAEFYDVFGMPDGRLAITIGHLVGAGVSAGAVAAQVKVGLRGAALTSSDPNAIFSTVDGLVGQLDRTWPGSPGHEQGTTDTERTGFGGELFVTALLGVFDPATGDLQLASAGHLPPAVVHHHPDSGTHPDSGSSTEYVSVEPGPPLGIPGARPVSQLVLHEGDALVAVTDELLRRQDRSVEQGRSELTRVLGTMTATAARSISQHVVDTFIGDQGVDHDCALLVVVRDSRHDHRATSVLVPAHTIAVRGARRWVQAQLESWGVDEEDVATAVMCVSELVTNVVQHAGTSARLTMELANRLLVTVEDTGTWSAPRIESENQSAVQGRGLALVSAVSSAMGHARGADGSTVWFEISLDHEAT